MLLPLRGACVCVCVCMLACVRACVCVHVRVRLFCLFYPFSFFALLQGRGSLALAAARAETPRKGDASLPEHVTATASCCIAVAMLEEADAASAEETARASTFSG